MLISDIQNEVSRELAIRKGVFPRLVRDGRLTQGEADERMDRLHAALATLKRLRTLGLTYLDDLAGLSFIRYALTTESGIGTPSSHIKGGAQ